MMWETLILEVVWVPTEEVAPLEVAKLVPPLELLLLCWGYSESENVLSESVAKLLARVKFVSVFDILFCARCGKSV